MNRLDRSNTPASSTKPWTSVGVVSDLPAHSSVFFANEWVPNESTAPSTTQMINTPAESRHHYQRRHGIRRRNCRMAVVTRMPDPTRMTRITPITGQLKS